MSAYQPAADPTAVVGKRVVAFIIDWIILLAVNWIPFVLLADSGDIDRVTCSGLLNQCTTVNSTVYGLSSTNAAIVQVISWGYAIGIFVFLQGFKGFTPGKAIMGLRVVNPEGGAPGPVKALIRWVLLIVDLLPYCIPGLLGFILILTGKDHTRLGDRAAKTFVVGKNDVGRPIGSPVMAADPYGTPVGAAAGAYGAPAGAAPYTPAAPPVTDAFAAAPPVAEPAPAPAAEAAAAPAPSGAEPQWDPARNAYIQWDAAQGSWLQFDDATQQWRPIDQ
ncbi:MAG: RDD family protein [Acidimicrobiales bacterium]|nr:RDD family protein [Acidimicrobiales bacterium]